MEILLIQRYCTILRRAAAVQVLHFFYVMQRKYVFMVVCVKGKGVVKIKLLPKKVVPNGVIWKCIVVLFIKWPVFE